MIHNLRTSFGELVDENTWMDDTTRALAKEKVFGIDMMNWSRFIEQDYLK
jgi:hypothetical protein